MEIPLCSSNTSTLLLFFLECKLFIWFPDFFGNVILSNLLLYKYIWVLLLCSLLMLSLVLLHHNLFPGEVWETWVFIILGIFVYSKLWYFLPSILWKGIIHYHSLLTIFGARRVSLACEWLQNVLWFLLSVGFYDNWLIFTVSTFLIYVLWHTIELIGIVLKLNERATSLML